MTEPETFMTIIDKLTKETFTYIDRDKGMELHTRKPLLLQLREAVFAGMENGGSGSAFGSKPPIDDAALDLLNEITAQAAEVLAIVDPHPTPLGHAEHYVRLWSGQVTEGQVFTITEKRMHENDKLVPRVYDQRFQISAYRLAQRWMERIQDFFDPPSTREIQAPCPQCGERYVYRQKDGQTVRSAALNFIRDRHTNRTIEARCSNSECGASWAPPQFEFLAKLIDAKPIPELVDTPAD